jgi:chromosome segregation ATPase
LLKLKLPFLKYREKADEYNLKVEEKKAIKKKLDEAKELSAPTHNEIKRAHEEAERARKAVHELGNELETKQMAIKEILDRLKGEQEKIGKCAKDLDRQEEMKKAKTKECKNLKASIRKLTTEIENRIDPTERMEELKEQRRQLQRESREVKGDKAAVDKKLQDAKTDMVRLEHKYASINQELRALTDARQKKLRSLQNWDMNTYSISHWISQSRNLFSAKISDPLFMEVTVRNLNYANMIESIVGRNLKLAFVCRTKNDYDKLLYHANDQMKKSVNVLHFEGCDLQSYEPPMPREALRKLGFDGYAIDFIDAEDSIKIALCDQANFHRIPIAMRPVNHDLVVRAGIYNYLADNRHVAVIKSKYGAQLATTKTSVCDKAKNWGGEQVDKSKVASLNQELADIAAKMNEKKAIQADLLKVATAFEQKEMEAVEALTQLNEEFRRLTEKEKEIRQKQANLKIKEENLVKLQKEISEMTTQQIEQRMVNAVERKVELTLKLKVIIGEESFLCFCRNLFQIVQKS